MEHLNMFRVRRGSEFLSKLSAFLLAFLLLISPLAPAFAQEAATPATPPTSDSSSTSTNTLDPATSDTTSEPSSTADPVAPPATDPKATPEEGKDAPPTDEQAALAATSAPTENLLGAQTADNKTKIDQKTGSLDYSYEFQIPQGRNNLTPKLVLSYNSSNSTETSVFGNGWSFSIPSIKRLNRYGVEKMYDSASEVFYSSIDGELVLVDPALSTYRPKVENGDFRLYTYANNSWSFTDKYGVVYIFGGTAQAQQNNLNSPSLVYQWMLETVTDTNNNSEQFNYYKETGQIYPDTISYTRNGSTPGIFNIVFTREGRLSTLSSFANGFNITTSKRISEIRAEINGSWVNKYSLSYKNADNGQDALLGSITESGRDLQTGTVVSKPATTFDYTVSTPGWTYTPGWNFPFRTDVLDSGRRLGDINGDGLLDSAGPSMDINLGDRFVGSTTWTMPPMGGLAGSTGEVFATFDYRGVASPQSMLADINGDALPDIIRSSQYNSNINYLYSGNGINGWSNPSTSSFSGHVPFSTDGSDDGKRLGDINGDGLLDSVGPSTDMNTGSSFVSSNSWVMPPMGGLVGSTREVFSYLDYRGTPVPQSISVDINSDGLSDVVHVSNSFNYVYLNNGVSSANLTPGWNFPFRTEGRDDGRRLGDINGDGLLDSAGPSIDINTGNSFVGSGSWVMPPTGGIAGATREVFSVTDDRGNTSQVSILADVNGDGLSDIVHASNTFNYVYLNNTRTKTNLLKRITTSYGGVADIEYKPSTQYKDGSGNLLNNHLPSIVYAVSKITQTDPVAGVSSRSEYVYSGGEQFFKGPYDKEFAGFEKVEEKIYDNLSNTLLRKVVTYFHQGDVDSIFPIKNAPLASLGESTDTRAKIGKIFRTEVYDGSNNLYHVDITKWDSSNIALRSDFVYPVVATSRLFNGTSSPKDIATTYTYNNANGNLLSQVNMGEVTGSDDGSFTDTGTDKSTSTYTYASGGNIVGLPSSVVVVDQSSNKVKESRYYYDTLALGSVSKGNLTKQEDWKTGTTYINSQKTYNTYGLVVSDTDPRGKVTSYAYDTFNLYPTAVTNPLNQTTNYTYNYSFGKVATKTDPNGKLWATVYDGFGRTLEDKIPDPAGGTSAVTKTVYVYADTANALSIHKTDYLDATNSIDTYQYFDGLGRIVQERKEAEVPGNFNVKDTAYNSLGLVQKQSLPYTSSGYARTPLSDVASLFTVTTYDAFMRPLMVSNSVGSTSYAYNLWTTTITDPNGKQKKYSKDAYNNLSRVDEINSGITYATNYEWNLNNKLTKITDALGNIRNFTYDGLGRRLTAQDLHAPADTTYGTWNYVYDDAGNTIQTISPNALTVNYTYNDINQVLTEDYTGVAGVEISYTYGGCTNGIGRLCSVAMTEGVNTSYTYDSNGNIASDTRSAGATSYTTSYVLDRQGNITNITYSDNSQSKYTFNTAGLLEKIERKEGAGAFADVVSNFDYSPMDQITIQAYANTTNTTNTYDASKMYRLTRKLTIGTGSSSGNNPVITLTGATLIKLNVGDTWSEPGYSATDLIDGNITSSVTVTGSVNTSIVGTYQLVYAAVNSLGVPATRVIRTVVVSVNSSPTISVLAVGGGGGGGGYDRSSGGGGAGGYQYDASHAVIPKSYSVTVGVGGAAGTSGNSDGVSGGNSVFDTITATGGGGGCGTSGAAGLTGGSGGGGCANIGIGGTGLQGRNGGTAGTLSGGGGGGSGTVGGNGSGTTPGNGGNGTSNSITGSAVVYAGGGGGYNSGNGNTGTGGTGGGGHAFDGSNTSNGTDGLGGGGGAAGASGNPGIGRGGKGVVIISYTTTDFGPCTGGTITTNGTKTVHKFTSDGTFTVVARPPSNTKPTITLTGSNLIDLNVNGTWSEPGYSATDTEDGTLTSAVTVTGSVNTSVAGTYQLVYAVVDSGGMPAARVIRTVVVGSPSTVTKLQDLNYTYDAVGNITQIVDASNTNAAKTANYVYDDLYRLISATITAVPTGQTTYTQNFTYDALGNILSGPNGAYLYQGNTGTLKANPHAATSINGVTYSYDANGNLTTNGTITNTWNYRDKIKKSVVGANTMNYLYDHNGDRVKYTKGTAATYYMNKYFTINSAGKKTKQIYAGGELVATIETVGTTVSPYYVLTDNLGSTNVVTNSTGTSAQLLDYYPYGNQRISSGTYTAQRQYIGQIYDADTGLDYLNARYYKADVGRFVSQDSMFWKLPTEVLIDPQQQNSYSYARNNPINMKDPSGNLTVKTAIKSALTAIGSFFKTKTAIAPASGEAGTPKINSTSKILNSPVGNAPISSKFGEQRSYELHPGIDYRVPVGTPVYATAPGTVVRADKSDSYGNMIVINNGPVYFLQQRLGNAYTLDAHGSSLVVSVGDNVNTGDLIMYSGNTGQMTTGPHLHHEVVVTPDTYPKNFYKNFDIRYSPDSLKDLLTKQY